MAKVCPHHGTEWISSRRQRGKLRFYCKACRRTQDAARRARKRAERAAQPATKVKKRSGEAWRPHPNSIRSRMQAAGRRRELEAWLKEKREDGRVMEAWYHQIKRSQGMGE